jgi:hypothetical protein
MKKEIKNEQTIRLLLEKMPEEVANSFNEEQLTHLFTALGTKEWAKHSVDLRGTYKIPFIAKRYYYVILLGQNRRDLSRSETQLSTLTMAVILSVGFVILTLLGLLTLYLLKSALGINLFEGYSLGIWTWFKGLWH